MNFKAILTPFINFEILKSNNQKMNFQFDGFVHLYSKKSSSQFKSAVKKCIEEESLSYQEKDLMEQNNNSFHFLGTEGPVWFLNENEYGAWRDKMGLLSNQIRNLKLKNILFHVHHLDDNDIIGVVTGLELSMYQFLPLFKNENIKSYSIHFLLDLKSKNKNVTDLVEKAQTRAASIQLARHLVNLPPNYIHPESLQKIIQKDLSFSSSTQIKVWDSKMCEKEGLDLLNAVGAGANHPPRLIHLKYRPKKKTKDQPIAFVGKGITFDTGGLDIKPSSAMRLMKKDMGGAAAVLGLAYWVDQIQYSKPCDFYVALAENSVDGNSMRPSDVYKSHAGYLVEIDNTDAEGRLVLADAMSVAIQSHEKPKALIDVATLTGAIKVALGTDVAGLFCNDDNLAEKLNKAGQNAGEPNWRMPLVKKYWSSLSSQFADFRNSGEGFGGAITAALFLEKFSGNVPWAHLDIYSWADRPDGAISSSGGNGQAVQTLISYLESLV